MSKAIVYFVIITIILAVGVFAETRDVKKEIKNFVEEKGISIGDENITPINFSDLPKEVDIEKIKNTSIAIYKVDYSKKPLFVITSSDEKFKGNTPVPSCDTKSLLYFSLNQKIKKSEFLDMTNGIRSSTKKGYVMIREGSITGISTNMEVIKPSDDGEVEIVIYKNGKEVGFRNILDVSSSGTKIDYDTQSKGIVNFKAGDIISAYLNSKNNTSLTDITTTIEITY